jgi:hypothetical protein
MFEYGICNQADEIIFEKQCLALEKNIPRLIKEDSLIDVDGSKTQRYNLNGSEVTICNSYYLNEVYIKSDIELEQYFK